MCLSTCVNMYELLSPTILNIKAYWQVHLRNFYIVPKLDCRFHVHQERSQLQDAGLQFHLQFLGSVARVISGMLIHKISYSVHLQLLVSDLIYFLFSSEGLTV